MAKGLDEAWCKGCDTGLILPDRVFFMDLPPEEISKRGGFGEERYERLEFQMKARELFHKLIKNDASGKWKMVDANRDVSCIADDLLNETKQVISAVSESDIQEKLFA
jgi:dTMP kinase